MSPWSRGAPRRPDSQGPWRTFSLFTPLPIRRKTWIDLLQLWTMMIAEGVRFPGLKNIKEVLVATVG